MHLRPFPRPSLPQTDTVNAADLAAAEAAVRRVNPSARVLPCVRALAFASVHVRARARVFV